MRLTTGLSFTLICLSYFTVPTESTLLVEQDLNSTVTTDPSTDSTSPSGPCASNPCGDKGFCEANGDTFQCECNSGFTGVTCETAICSCPRNSQCFQEKNGVSFYCVCDGNFTGPNCDKVDIMVTCKDGKSYRHLLKDSLSPILCTANNNTDINEPSTICHDPDNAIVFKLSNNPNGLFYLEVSDSSEETCLYVNASEVTLPSHCVNLVAYEADDIETRSLRQATYSTCVVFNEKPQLIPILTLVTVNIADASVGEPVFTAQASDPFGFGKFTYSIADVSPQAWRTYFQISNDQQNETVVTWHTLPISIDIPSQGQVVDFVIQVEDGGQPPLTSSANVTVVFINASLSCFLPDIFYVALQKPPSGAIGQISCVGVTSSDRLQYTLDPNGFTNLTIQGSGDIVVNTENLQPGNYSVTVIVTGQFVKTSISFNIYADYFQLHCPDRGGIFFIFYENEPVQTCQTVYACSGDLISEVNSTCSTQLYGALSDYLTLKCETLATIISVDICVAKSLINQGVEGTHKLFGTLDTIYGLTNITIGLDITDTFNQGPSFTSSSFTTTTVELQPVGTFLVTASAVDPDQGDVLSYSLTGNDVPFNISNDGIIATTRILNATEKLMYLFQAVVIDTGANTATATVQINVMDVNEPPICQHQNNQYIIVIQANSSANSVIGKLECYDVDLGSNAMLTYSIDSSFSTDLFAVSPSGEIKLIRSVKSADSDSYMFNVTITDGGGLITVVEVSVKINSDFPPSCPSAALSGKISEDASLSDCVSVQSNCVDPLSGNLQFSIQGLNGSAYFEIQDRTQDPVQICTKTSIKGKYGVLSLNIQVSNGFGVTFIRVDINVTDVNDPPSFRSNSTDLELSENVIPGTVATRVQATDGDKGTFSKLTYRIDNPLNTFQIDSSSGSITVTNKLNASITQSYKLKIIATDGGGLSASMEINIKVIDINEPPVCDSPVQVIVNLTTPVGTNLNRLNCWDWDVSQDYGDIVYSTDPKQAGVFGVTTDGTIKVSSAIPRTLTSFNFDVTVRDKIMDQTGNYTGQKTVTVQFIVNTNFPPNCSKTDISGTFDETQGINDCLDKEITCTDPTGGAVYIDSIGGSGTGLTQVRNRTTDKLSQLPLNLCIKSDIKSKLGEYQVFAFVNNGLGTTRVTWNYEILDVNEAPVFFGAPYNTSIPETKKPGSSIYSISVTDPDSNQQFKTVFVESKMKNEGPGDSQAIVFLQQCCFFVMVQQNATERNLYEFDLVATDGGNLTTRTTASIHVLDVNEPPKCSSYNVQLQITLLTKVNQVVYGLGCYDTDKDDNNRLLKYTVQGSDYFKVNSDGDILLAAPLPRTQSSHGFNVIVSDNGIPPLSVTVSVNIAVDNKIPPECQQSDVTYPDKWVFDKCVTVKMNCRDPTSAGTDLLTYDLKGNFTTGFRVTTLEKGKYEFCYKLTTNGNFMITVQVYNGLAYHFENIPLEVKYEQSTPQFTQSVYSMSLNENAPAGSALTAVQASSPSGQIIYSVTGSNFQEWETYFQIDGRTGRISTKTSIMRLSDTKVTLNIQALNDFSLLKSTTQVVITIIDVNEAPSCTASETGDKNLNVDVGVGTIVRRYTCEDTDVNELNKKIEFTMSTVPDNIPYFEFERTGDNVQIKIKQELAVNIGTYVLTLLVSDSASPPKNTSYDMKVVVNLTPPLPVVSAYAVNSTQINVQWQYRRKDFYNVTTKFYIQVTSSSDTTRRIPVDSRDTSYIITSLKPETVYQVSVTAETLYGNINTSPISVKTSAVPLISNAVCSLKITNEDYDQRLGDPDSFVYVQLQSKVVKEVTTVLRDTPGFVSCRVLSFRAGSVIVDLQLSTNQTGNSDDTSNVLKNKISSGWIGSLGFDPQYFVSAGGNGYVRVTSLTSNLVTITNNSRVVFTCMTELIGQVGTVRNTWKMNGSPIQPSPSSRFSISKQADDPLKPQQKVYTLTFDPIYVRDEGTLSCSISDDAGLTSEMEKSFLVIHQPVIIISPRSKTLSKGDNVNITCVVESPLSPHPATITWYKNGNRLQVSAGESIVILGQYAEILVVKNLQSRVVYGCSANNTAGTGVIQTSNIGVISAQSYKCDKDEDSAGTMWHITVEEATDVKNCPDGRIGTATRKCLTGGVWDNPDYSHCASRDLLNIQEKTEKLKEGQIVDNLQNVLTDLANLTSDTQTNFVEGEMEASMTILSNVAEYSANNADEVTDITLERTVQCASDLLDPRYFSEWEGLMKKNKNGASKIMESVGQISIRSTERQQASSQIIAKKNIVVENRKIENEDIVFPDKSKGTYPEWVKDNTRAKISKAALTGGQPAWTSGVYYRNLTDMLHPYLLQDNTVINMKNLYDVNSDILEIAMDKPPKIFNPAIELQFENLGDNYSLASTLCGWWDFNAKNTPNGAWSTEGCSVYKTSETLTICQCNHLTNFAVLMSPGKTPEHHILPLSIISAVGCGLSILFLIITVGVYAAFWRYVKSDRAIILMNLCVALILAYAVFLAGVNRTENKDICTAVAALLHYFFLVAFFMMLAEGIEIAVSVLYVFSTKSRISWLMPCGWIIPAIVVGISLGVTQLKGYGNTQFCWLSLEDGVLWAFVAPVCLIILVNFIIVCIVLKTMLSSHIMMTKTAREQTKSAVRSLCVILPIMGVSWVLGVFSVNEDLVIFQYIFAVCNTLQGLFIFLFHCLTNRQIHDAMKHSRRRKRSLADFTKSTSHVHSNSKGEKEKESSENMQNNMEAVKKANPFLEADRQVHEIVGKLAKKEDKKNAFDGKDSEKNVGKDNILSLDDIKISNIVRESEVSANTGNVNISMVTAENKKADSQNSGSEVSQKPDSITLDLGSSKQSQHSGSDRGQHSGSHHSGSHHSGSDRGHHSGSDRDKSSKSRGQVNPSFRSSVASSHQYDSVNDFYLGSVGETPFSAVYEPQRNPQTAQTSQPKPTPVNQPSGQQTNRSYESLMQQQRVQPSSSYQGLDPSRYSSSQQSRSQQPFILAPGDPGPQNRRVPAGQSHNPSFNSDSGSKKSKDKKGKEQQKPRYSPKAQRKNIEHEPSQRQQMPHWGKAKQAAAAKKQMKSQVRDERSKSQGRDDRSRSRDRSRAYAVPVDHYYEQPYARHPSLENVSAQYVGFDPFGGAHQGYGRPRQSRYSHWDEPRVDYW